MDENKLKIDGFIKESKAIISQYFKSKTINSKTEIWDVYPYIFSDNEKNNNYISENNIIDLSKNIGDVYERIVPANIRKDYGQFYTKNESILNSVISKVDVLSGKILEPSCGSGLFLVRIIETILKKLKDKGHSNREILTYIINNIYGIDIDENACKIAEINIIITILPLIIEMVNNDEKIEIKKINIYCQDFLSFKEKNKFSVVVGNPPFVTMYGRRSRNMTEELREYFNTFDFVQNKKGNNKFNISMFFVENGLKSLKEKGKLAFILDISFFEPAFKDLRKYIVENYYINSITVGLQEFEDVASGQIILEITNVKSKNKEVIWNDVNYNQIYIINQSKWNNSKTNFRFFKPLDNAEKSINEKMNIHPPLSHYYPNKELRTCCALTGRTDDFIVDPLNEKEHTVFPYLEGSKGFNQKFGKLNADRHIKYDYDLQIKISDEFKKELEEKGVKNKKRVTLGDKKAYESPKIFIRQSAPEIIATFTKENYAANNSIYILTNKSNDEKEINRLKYILGILNSDLITYYALLNDIIKVRPGKTPQMRINDLKRLKIAFNEEYYYELIKIVNKLLDNPNDKILLLKLNEMVYKIYNLTEYEINEIKKTLN